ncbi:tRNA-dihydrouridine synthase family protein [Saccharicrinis aurantiacus]|uniref:tRNA-dihydrouridine synthase family protein n=1 Tax=Saccharicrinis aurantiacus TaxID=1849719 RepID=UPI002491EC6A|nr:tRNA-dihydrouridine synthase family protein [Saccharicrinis aurantiacus]
MIYLAPLQSYTNLFYIKAFSNHIGGVDKYFTPFYRVGKNGAYNAEKELLAEEGVRIVPQVLCNTAKDLNSFAKCMITRNFDEINLNMGCPFPMVVNKRLGSGVLPHPELVDEMLSGYFKEGLDIQLSVKLRLGKTDASEFNKILETLNKYPISELIIHPRLGSQKYSGTPDWDTFEEFKDQFNFPVIGNGDLLTNMDVTDKSIKHAWVNGWMIGRGLLRNPFLLQGVEYGTLDFYLKMMEFHKSFSDVIKSLDDVKKLNLLKVFWEYPLADTVEGKRLYRKLRKLGSYSDYSEWLTKFKSQFILG